MPGSIVPQLQCSMLRARSRKISATFEEFIAKRRCNTKSELSSRRNCRLGQKVTEVSPLGPRRHGRWGGGNVLLYYKRNDTQQPHKSKIRFTLETFRFSCTILIHYLFVCVCVWRRTDEPDTSIHHRQARFRRTDQGSQAAITKDSLLAVCDR